MITRLTRTVTDALLLLALSACADGALPPNSAVDPRDPRAPEAPFSGAPSAAPTGTDAPVPSGRDAAAPSSGPGLTP